MTWKTHTTKYSAFTITWPLVRFAHFFSALGLKAKWETLLECVLCDKWTHIMCFCLLGSLQWWEINSCARPGKRRWRPSGRRSWWNGIPYSLKRRKPGRKRWARAVWCLNPCNVKVCAPLAFILHFLAL